MGDVSILRLADGLDGQTCSFDASLVCSLYHFGPLEYRLTSS
jgi:hypothetical protein